MSYCVSLRDRDTGDVATTALPLSIDGDNICLNPDPGTALSTNITYNYRQLFVKAFADGLGLKSLHGCCAEDSIPDLCVAIAGLGDDCDSNYYKDCDGNAKMALLKLLQMAAVAPGAVWEVA